MPADLLLPLFNGLLVVVVAFQVFWMIRQTKWMRKSGEAASESADVAARSLATLKDTAIRQLRAYVFVDTIDVVNIIPPPPGEVLPAGAWNYQPAIGPMAYIIIKNSGQTPAYDVLTWADIKFLEFPNTSPLPYGDRNAPGLIKTKLTLPAEGKSSKSIKLQQPLTNDEIEKLRATTHAIYVYGDITYKDAFDNQRTSNFRYFINGFTGFTHLSNTMSGCPEGNEAD